MVMEIRIIFLIAALAALCLCVLALLNMLTLYWGVNSTFSVGVPWGIAFLATWVILEGFDIWVRVKSSALQCPHCDQSLRGIKCPECGERLDSTNQAA